VREKLILGGIEPEQKLRRKRTELRSLVEDHGEGLEGIG
jgi:hypothetical protein